MRRASRSASAELASSATWQGFDNTARQARRQAHIGGAKSRHWCLAQAPGASSAELMPRACTAKDASACCLSAGRLGAASWKVQQMAALQGSTAAGRVTGVLALRKAPCLIEAHHQP